VFLDVVSQSCGESEGQSALGLGDLLRLLAFLQAFALLDRFRRIVCCRRAKRGGLLFDAGNAGCGAVDAGLGALTQILHLLTGFLHLRQ
jgi:hypothetical protein